MTHLTFSSCQFLLARNLEFNLENLPKCFSYHLLVPFSNLIFSTFGCCCIINRFLHFLDLSTNYLFLCFSRLHFLNVLFLFAFNLWLTFLFHLKAIVIPHEDRFRQTDLTIKLIEITKADLHFYRINCHSNFHHNSTLTQMV